MGIFVDYLSDPFPNISGTDITILEADTNFIQVNGLIVCNTGPTTIRFNLKKERVETLPIPGLIEIFYINQFEIKPFETVDVVAKVGIQIFLEYYTTPNPIILKDRLKCFTNAANQMCDCEISYTRLNELPLV